MAEREYLIAPWIRLWHWTNAALIVTLGVTGLSLHFASPELPLVDFALAVRIHNTAGVLLIVTYLGFVVGNIVTGNWWQFVPKPPGILQRIVRQALWYGIGIFRGEPHPFKPSSLNKHNPLQRLTYLGILVCVSPLLWITGWLLYFYGSWKAWGLETLSLEAVAVAHTVGAFLMLAFLISHLYLVTTGRTPTAHLKAMVTGWEEH